MIDIKVKDLIFSGEKLAKLSNIQLPIKLSYAVGRNIKKVKSELQTIEEKQVELITKHGAEQTQGGWQIVPPKLPQDPTDKEKEVYDKELAVFKSKIEAYRKEEVELLEETISIDLFPLKLSAFPEDTKVSADILVGLDFLIEDN